MTPPSKLKMESPPGKNGSVGWGKFVVILVRNRIMLLVIMCSHLTISDGRDFSVPSLVIISLTSSSSSAFLFLYLWAHSPVWSMKGPYHIGIYVTFLSCPDITCSFSVGGIPETGFLHHIQFYTSYELPNKLWGADTMTSLLFLSE